MDFYVYADDGFVAFLPLGDADRAENATIIVMSI
jgi:hypothetical protein